MDPSSSSSLSKRKRDPDSFDDEPNSRKRRKNDLFLNYSFENIGKRFISHLKGALKHNSFTMSDHTMLPVGQDVCLDLLKAIEDSEIFVVVFCGKYASDVRCLDELVHIMDCRREVDGRKVVPVFLNVEPSHVRSQKGRFKKPFKAHETNVDPERVQKWKQALKDAGRLTGLALQNGDEAEFVQKIVEELEKMQCPQELHVTDHPVGIGSRAEELISKLRLECEDDVFVVAVFGISGIGKTAIVKETYNRIAAKFNVSCFLEDIHYLCQAPNWKVKLRKKLISYITQNDKQRITYSYHEGVTKIKRLVSRRKVLLVLDDVDNYQQLEALGINPKWFYNGSRIIITTRDKQSLGNILYESYHTKLLNRRESLNLFTRLMFARDDLVNTKFVKEVVSRAGGLPLVLKVWSCHFKHYEREQWPSILETLKRIPHGDVQKQLKMSYDSLSNRSKKLFLDIACFFDGMEKDLVVKVLQDEDSTFFPDYEIQYLVAKSLVKMRDSWLQMHDAIRKMGKEIVRQENEDEPGQRTRLCDERDVMRVLTECSGTESVESITLKSYWKREKVAVQVEALRKMKNLRLIHSVVENVSWSNSSHDEVMTPLSFKKLKYMEWHYFPFKSINNIEMGNVVVLRLRASKLEILWEGMKSLKKLRILDVRQSYSLTKTGDFYGLENIVELYLSGCINLEELDRSIGCLDKLAILDLRKSIRLERLPWEMIGNLPSLQQLKVGKGLKDNHFLFALKVPVSLLQLHNLNTIELVDCDMIRSIPNLPRNITSIKLWCCKSLVNLPSNMCELKSLVELDITSCPKLESADPQFLMKVTGLTNLSHLCMDNCNVSQVPSEIGNLVSLKKLNLSCNTFSSLPDSFSNLSQLVDLNISGCDQLRLLPLLPSNLTNTEAHDCKSLDVKSSGSIRTKVGKESPFTKPLVIRLSLSEEVPDWCSYRSKGGILSFVAPRHSDNKICGIILSANSRAQTLIPRILNKTKNTSHRPKVYMSATHSRYMYVMFYPLDNTTLVVEPGDAVVLKFKTCRFSSYWLRLIYDSDVVDSKIVIQTVSESTPP